MNNVSMAHRVDRQSWSTGGESHGAAVADSVAAADSLILMLLGDIEPTALSALVSTIRW
jgi:hypothetical protein